MSGIYQLGMGALASTSDLSAKVGYFGKLSSGSVAIAGAGEGEGVITDGGNVSGDRVALSLGAPIPVVAGAAIALNAKLQSDAAGKARTAESGDAPIGRALTAADADGDWFWAVIFPVADEVIP